MGWTQGGFVVVGLCFGWSPMNDPAPMKIVVVFVLRSRFFHRNGERERGTHWTGPKARVRLDTNHSSPLVAPERDRRKLFRGMLK